MNNRVSRFFQLAVFGSIVMTAPAAWATTATFAGPYTSANSITFTNWNSLGVNLTVLCGVGSSITTGTLGGNTCRFDDANGGTTGTPLGVTSTGIGDSAWIDGHSSTSNDEFIMFRFNNNVTLTNVGLNVNGTSNWAFYACSGTAVSTCTTQLLNVTGTTANTNFTSGSFSSTGENFAIIATSSTNTAFGINSLSGDFASAPEPATLGLVGASLLGLGGLGLRRRKSKQQGV